MQVLDTIISYFYVHEFSGRRELRENNNPCSFIFSQK